jgi:8-oxo-dGTP pyrophosphatase MutT (NUDIX family)
MIGCIAVVKFGEFFVALECSKGRGRIMPGGKWEKGETFREAAIRELKEETGLVALTAEFAHVGPDEDGVPCYAFYATVNQSQVWSSMDVDYGSGKVVLATWSELLQSHYKGYYEVLKDVMSR